MIRSPDELSINKANPFPRVNFWSQDTVFNLMLFRIEIFFNHVKFNDTILLIASFHNNLVFILSKNHCTWIHNQQSRGNNIIHQLFVRFVHSISSNQIKDNYSIVGRANSLPDTLAITSDQQPVFLARPAL